MGVCGSTNSNKHERSQNYTNQTQQNAPQKTSTFQRCKTKDPELLKRGKTMLLKRKAEYVENVKVEGGKEKIEMFFSLTNVEDPDCMYKVKVYINNDKKTNNYVELMESNFYAGSEITFETTCVTEYYFEREQLLRVEVYKEEFGIVYTENSTVGRLMGSRKNILSIDTEQGFHLVVEAKNAAGFDVSLTFDIRLEISGSYRDIYLIINNFNDDKNWRRVYKSEEIPNPGRKFDQIILDSDIVNRGNPDRKILFEFAQFDGDIIGGVHCTVRECMASPRQVIVDMNGTPIGNANISVMENKIFKFIDMLKSGLQIALAIGVDYTNSNGDPTDKNSLHFCQGREPNPYERAISSCGSIVGYYDSDQKFPLWGFGGKPGGSGQVNHCFPVNFSDDPEITGLDNVIACYRSSLSSVQLSGPTYFSPLINTLNNMVRQDLMNDPYSKNYNILMILTDGMINDMDATCDAIVESAKLPISIIIIGIGNADFSNMDILDGDDDPLTNTNNEVTERDIVQFVPFNKFEGNYERLAEEVLEEVPRQVEQYYQKHRVFD